jgi:hypothetical protein
LLARHIAKAHAMSPSELLEPGIGELLHRRALRCLSDRAAASIALAELLERALARHKLDAVLVPFDHEPVAKVLVRTAQAHGVPVLALQHGYEPLKRFAPGEFSDALGQWSRWDLAALPPEQRARARVVGNPSRGTIRSPSSPQSVPPHAVVLIENRWRFSALMDQRVSALHLAAALEGLRQSRHDWRITVRPHPSDDVAEFRALAAELGVTRMDIETKTPMLDLLSSAQVCVGALSTAALQTALTGTRLVMLMPQPFDCVPPLDGSGQVMYATNASELCQAVDAAMDAPQPPGRAELLEALGCGSPDPTAHILNWIRELAASSGQDLIDGA